MKEAKCVGVYVSFSLSIIIHTFYLLIFISCQYLKVIKQATEFPILRISKVLLHCILVYCLTRAPY